MSSRPAIPSITDLFINTIQGFAELIQGLAIDTHTNLALAQPCSDDNSTFDLVSQSWAGDGGLRYKVPLLDLPSEQHAIKKRRNVRILLDNIRTLCVNDDLPATPEEMKFWSSYRFLKYQLYLKPFCITLPPVYLFLRSMQSRIPRVFKGKVFPFLVTATIAEQWLDATFPAHELLTKAMSAKTPLGDAARAEWQRLSPVNIPLFTFTVYQGNLIIDPNKEFQFGGNIAAALGN